MHVLSRFHLQSRCGHFRSLYFFTSTATAEIYTLSLHDALPISCQQRLHPRPGGYHHRKRIVKADPKAESVSGQVPQIGRMHPVRSEEHTSELQSRENLVCRLLLEKKNRTETNKSSNTIYACHTY